MKVIEILAKTVTQRSLLENLVARALWKLKPDSRLINEEPQWIPENGIDNGWRAKCFPDEGEYAKSGFTKKPPRRRFRIRHHVQSCMRIAVSLDCNARAPNERLRFMISWLQVVVEAQYLASSSRSVTQACCTGFADAAAYCVQHRWRAWSVSPFIMLRISLYPDSFHASTVLDRRASLEEWSQILTIISLVISTAR